ncbi:hypothetical protein BZZ01_22565 [Nostocales cyanobacterium HT-58-2]|nr:hypothetical protein BZZ01_22565 [Nostocales cyanobacterium HT-58-2]
MSQALFIDLSVEQQEIVAGGFDAAFNATNYHALNSLKITTTTLALAGSSGPNGSQGGVAFSANTTKLFSTIDTSQFTGLFGK